MKANNMTRGTSDFAIRIPSRIFPIFQYLTQIFWTRSLVVTNYSYY